MSQVFIVNVEPGSKETMVQRCVESIRRIQGQSPIFLITEDTQNIPTTTAVPNPFPNSGFFGVLQFCKTSPKLADRYFIFNQSVILRNPIQDEDYFYSMNMFWESDQDKYFADMSGNVDRVSLSEHTLDRSKYFQEQEFPTYQRVMWTGCWTFGWEWFSNNMGTLNLPTLQDPVTEDNNMRKWSRMIPLICFAQDYLFRLYQCAICGKQADAPQTQDPAAFATLADADLDTLLAIPCDAPFLQTKGQLFV